MFAKSIAMSGLAAIASAHILMTNPVPYGKSTLSNGPLAADGSDFPCKQRSGVYNDEGASNVYAQGSKQQLEFQGTAVHGGGSCQVSITTDLKPTKNSVWKVIKSIEGGCPAKDQTGNMGNSASAAVPYKYDFTIPSELAAGNYTIAWTWFNKVGNREMYMNCAPMAVTGSAGSQSFMNGLPDMFVANIGPQCQVPDGKDVVFPNPGKDLDKFNGQTSAWGTPVGGGCQTAGAGGAAPSSAPGGGSAPQPTTSNMPVQPTSVQTSSASPSNGGSPSGAPGGIFITSAESEPAPTQMPGSGNSSVPAMSSSMPAPTSAPANPGSGTSPSSGGGQSPAPVPTGGSGSGNGSSPSPSPSGGHAAGSACTSDGAWNCIGGKSFQRCASGMWSAVQAMAAGVSCESGESADLKMAAAVQGRRTMRRALRIRA